MIKDVHFSGWEAACKVCGGPAALYGVVDFNKNCLEVRGVYLPLTGVPVYYHECKGCGLIFSNAFDTWSAADFQEHIYNAEYINVDPDYVDTRPRQTAEMVFNFIKQGSRLQVLDYGSGNGLMSQVLCERGIDATSWDPVNNEALPDKKDFDVVTCFEVFEHAASPQATNKEILTFLAPSGVVVFSTLTTDQLPYRDVGYWYIAPRKGHITIYSRKALKTLFAGFGYKVHHFNDNVHMAYRDLPAWLAPAR